MDPTDPTGPTNPKGPMDHDGSNGLDISNESNGSTDPTNPTNSTDPIQRAQWIQRTQQTKQIERTEQINVTDGPMFSTDVAHPTDRAKQITPTDLMDPNQTTNNHLTSEKTIKYCGKNKIYGTVRCNGAKGKINPGPHHRENYGMVRYHVPVLYFMVWYGTRLLLYRTVLHGIIPYRTTRYCCMVFYGAVRCCTVGERKPTGAPCRHLPPVSPGDKRHQTPCSTLHRPTTMAVTNGCTCPCREKRLDE